MRCPDTGTLRALLDGEAPVVDRAAIDAHVAACPHCAEAVRSLGTARDVAASRLAALPGGEGDAETAYARFRHRVQNERTWDRRWRMLTDRARRWPALAATAGLVAVILVLATHAPARALAQQFLSIFRVQSVQVIRFDPESLDEEGVRLLVDQLQLLDPQIIADEPPSPAADVGEASERAGFAVRAPTHWPMEGETTIEVKGRTVVRVPYTREALEALFRLAGMDAGALPEGLGDGEVVGTVPAGVLQERVDLKVLQLLEPQLEYPEGVDARLLGEAALRVLGLPPEDAARMSARIDWTNTLVLPVPTTGTQVREVDVAGVRGILVTGSGEALTAWADDDIRPAVPSEPFATLIWQRDGILTAVSGPYPGTTLLDVAQSMY